jgi:HlyD family secretion protein
VVQTNLLSEKESDFIEIQANLAMVATQRAKADTAISEAELQIIQVKQEYSERADAELKDVRQQLIEIHEQLLVATNILNRTEVRASVAGSVQNLRIHTAGGVISPGTVLMEIVPQGDDLIINAQINPVDIDNVHTEQHTEIRFPSFSGHWTPVLMGKVETVSGDVITPENPNQPPYFLARITVPDHDVPDDIRSRVTAGMPAEVIMATGERTLLDYLISPLGDAVRKSLRER